MKRNLLFIIINIACMTVFLVCQVISAVIVWPLHAGSGGKVWAGQSGERFAQLAVFFPHQQDFSEESVYRVRDSIDSSLLAVSLESSDNQRLYADAWSAEGTVSIAGERGSANAPAIGVGGDYFLFHPLYLRNGSYISPNDVMRDRVVLDEELAWRLFGGVQLAGLEVLINDKPFLIAGVVRRESGFAYDHAINSTRNSTRATGAEGANEGYGGLFMSYEVLEAVTEEDTQISSYEIVMPDVVTDFARDTLKDAIGSGPHLIVSNTGRFSFSSLFDLLVSFGERSMRTDAITLPYWENANRYAEDWLMLLFGISLIVMVCPAVFAVIYSIRLARFAYSKVKDVVKNLLQSRENRAYTRYMQKQDTL